MKSINVTSALVAALVPLCTTLVEGSGKLWNNARDAYSLALVDFPAGKDAAAVIRQVITDNLKANPGSIKGYLSTLAWLTGNGHKVAGLTMGQATDLRYPKAPKAGEPGYQAHVAAEAAKKDAAAIAKRETEERNQTPRGQLLSSIAAMLATRDESTLSLIAAEIKDWLDALDGTETETETPEAIAA